MTGKSNGMASEPTAICHATTSRNGKLAFWISRTTHCCRYNDWPRVGTRSMATPKPRWCRQHTLNQEQNGCAGDVCEAKAATMPQSITEGMSLRDQRPISILIKRQLSNTNIFHRTLFLENHKRRLKI